MKLSSVPLPGPLRRLSPFGIGVLFILAAVLAGAVLFNKNAILTTLKPGDTIEIHFAANKGLVPDLSQAKVAWVPVGVVDDVERQDDGTVLVSVKVDKGTKDKLGSEPSAVIRPTTLLGGNYFVDLVPGGDRGRGAFSGVIPVERARQPVELDKVAGALQPTALKGAQGTIRDFDGALGSEGRAAIRDLVDEAPGALAPAADVLTAAQGTRPRTDLTKVVSGLESTARVLTDQQGQLDSIISGLKQSTGVFGGRAGELSSALAAMPSTMDSTRAGLSQLDVTLGKLRDTADPARPIAQELANALEHLDPVLAESRPVVRDLTALMVDAQPLVEQLNPLAQGATSVLRDVDGKPLQRVNGPVKSFVLSPFKGSGEYKTAQSDLPMYQDLGYMMALLDRAGMNVDRNGHSIGVAPGANETSVVTPDVTRMLAGIFSEYAPKEGAGR